MKVLITCPCLDKASGIENYVGKLIGILLKNFDVEIFIFPIFKYEKSKINNLFLNEKIRILENNFPIKYISLNHSKCAKVFEKYCNEQNFDFIIDNTGILPIPKKILILKNYFLIQHFDVKHFLYKINTLSGFIKRLWWFFNKYPIKFYHASNIVVFSECDEKIIKKNTKNKNQKFYKIPLSSFGKDLITKQKNNLEKNNLNKSIDLIYIGRIVKKYKRFNWVVPLFKVVQKNNWKIQIFGWGPYAEKLEKIINKKIVPIGLSDDNEKIRKYEKSFFSFLFSPYEGFPYAVVESLSLGVPVIIRNKFNSSNYFKPALKIKTFNKILFSKKTEKIIKFYKNNLDKYYKLCLNSIDFALNNLTNEIFEENWNKIFYFKNK